MANTNDFNIALEDLILEAKNKGEQHVDILSKDLHIKVGGYPGKNHSMPTCCDVMRKRMKSKDEVLYSPPKGRGASLKIRYYL